MITLLKYAVISPQGFTIEMIVGAFMELALLEFPVCLVFFLLGDI